MKIVTFCIIALILTTIIVGCSRGKYPDEYTNTLPFGLKYYMSESEAYSKMDSLVKIGELSKSYNNYMFTLPNNKDFEFNIEMRFHNDSLYYIDIRNYNSLFLSKQTDEKIFNAGMDFLLSQKIGLNSYEKHKEKISHQYKWNKQNGEEITYYTNNLIIIFNDGAIKNGLDKEEQQRNIEERKRRILNSMSNEDFCKSITDIDVGIYKATVTDSKILVLGIQPIGSPNFDVLAKSYLESAIEKGLDVDGCFVVDINKSTWIKGAVKGERIGKAYR